MAPVQFTCIFLLLFLLQGIICNPNMSRSRIKDCYTCNTILDGDACRENNRKALSKFKSTAAKGALGYPLCFVVITEYKRLQRRVDVERGAMGEIGGRPEWKADFGRKGCTRTEDAEKKLTVCLCYTDACNWRDVKKLDVEYDHMGYIVTRPCDKNINLLFVGVSFAMCVISSFIYCGLIGDSNSRRRHRMKLLEQAQRRQAIIDISEHALSKKSWERLTT